MTADGTGPAGGQAGSAGRDYRDGLGLGLTLRSLLSGRAGAPLWMRAELVRLAAAFPAFSFSIRPGWRGLMFEAWREHGGGGLYAVITQDPAELWRELEQAAVVRRQSRVPAEARRGEGPQANPDRDAG